MKLVIFAGGIGTRLWPLSRQNAPKQFDTIFNGKSTLQLAMDRVLPTFGAENIFVQTTSEFENAVQEQAPVLPKENIIVEPARRNLGPAVCLSVVSLQKRGYDGPMALLWADHLMDHEDEFVSVLHAGEKLITDDPERIVFLGERPRFANNNLGWIRIGALLGTAGDREYFAFRSWKYKPPADECDRMFRSGECFWNPGYFVTSVVFLLEQYRSKSPDVYRAVIEERYAEAEKVSFDRAIAEKIEPDQAVVIKTNMGWSDPGTLYALKEALEQSHEENVTHGTVETLETKDSLVYNIEKGKLVATVGLEGMVVVNTPDALVVVPKDDVVRITELLNQLKEHGKDQYL